MIAPVGSFSTTFTIFSCAINDAAWATIQKVRTTNRVIATALVAKSGVLGPGWIVLKQEYKGLSIRFAAQVIDGIVLGILFMLAVYVVFRTLFADAWMSPLDSFFYGAAIFGLLQFVYFTILEGITGTTIGKRAFKMKVVRENGQPCGMRSSLVRNILRFVDAISYLAPYVVAGFLFVPRSPKKQRLGDRVAQTVVVASAYQPQTGLTAGTET
jgi:uncharacterized RDD family membrane protein YckC